MTDSEARRRAEEIAHEILAPLRGERLEHEVYTVLARRVADAATQAVKERESMIDALAKDCDQLEADREYNAGLVQQQAAEVAALNRTIRDYEQRLRILEGR